MHQKSIVHGDIKDENIVIDHQLNAKLIDFGSAKIIPSETDYRIAHFQGTINYCSPEIANGTPYSGKKYDIWCTGVLLYTMLTGEVPFASINHIKEVIRRKPRIPLSHNASHLLDWLLQKDPKMRPTATDIIAHPWIQCD